MNIAILTNFQDLNLGYSLIGIALDQSRMLLEQGHKVFFFTSEQFNPGHNDEAGANDIFEHKNFVLENKSKFMHLVDYQSKVAFSIEHFQEKDQAAEIYVDHFVENDIHIVFTHDFIFTGWNLPFAEAVKVASGALMKIDFPVKWLHWIHSVPSGNRDWWNIQDYPGDHTIVFPNRTEKTRVMESFRAAPDQIFPIPHIKDIRKWYDFCPEAWGFTRMFPQIMSAAVSQIYPCSSDRLEAKQLDTVIRIFGFMKKAGMQVFLCAANQWATGKQSKENIQEYIKLAVKSGLEPGKDFVFTSEISKRFQNGISQRMIRDLQLLQNLFIFPTREESFGLVGPEAAYSGCLVVSNRDLVMMYEVIGNYAPAYHFGSHHQNSPDSKDDKWLMAVANSILARIFMNEAIMTKTYCRTRYNMTHLYEKYYLPAMSR